MAACYHPDVTFRDEAFDLRGPCASAMWHMLCACGENITLEASEVDDDRTGSARWIATYPFAATGWTVRNDIRAALTFEGGLIWTHRETFPFWSWSRQALGAPGMRLGWRPWLRAKVSRGATKTLDTYVARHPEARGA